MNCFEKAIHHLWMSPKSGQEFGPAYSVLRLAALAHSGLDIHESPAKECARRLEAWELDYSTMAKLREMLSSWDNRIQRGMA